MAAVDDQRKPVRVLPPRPFTPEEKRRFEQAKVRRALRQEFERHQQGMRLLPQ
jgi:hypothetical protein